MKRLREFGEGPFCPFRPSSPFKGRKGLKGPEGLLILLFLVAALPALTQASSYDPNETENVPFIQQTLDRSTDFYSNGMKSLVEDVLKITGAPDAKKTDLLKAADESVKDKMAKSKVGLWKTWKEMSKEGQVDQIQFWNAYRKLPEAILTPDRSPIWSDALGRILTPVELTKWSQEEGVRRSRIEKAIQDYLKRGRDEWRTKRIDNRRAEINEMETQAIIPATAAAALKNGVTAAVEKAVGSWGKGLEKQIRESLKSAFLGGAEDRIQALEGGQMNFGTVSDADGMQAEVDTWRALVQQTLDAPAFAAVDDDRGRAGPEAAPHARAAAQAGAGGQQGGARLKGEAGRLSRAGLREHRAAHDGDQRHPRQRGVHAHRARSDGRLARGARALRRMVESVSVKEEEDRRQNDE